MEPKGTNNRTTTQQSPNEKSFERRPWARHTHRTSPEYPPYTPKRKDSPHRAQRSSNSTDTAVEGWASAGEAKGLRVVIKKMLEEIGTDRQWSWNPRFPSLSAFSAAIVENIGWITYIEEVHFLQARSRHQHMVRPFLIYHPAEKWESKR